MTEFRTIVKAEKSPFQIQYDSKLAFFGSCFADNIGYKCIRSRFNTTVNPYGVLYNPLSVSNAIRQIMNKTLLKEEQLVLRNGLWHSFYHHGKFSNISKEECINNINSTTNEQHNTLINTDYLFITFGTAWVYQNLDTQKIVANCHKFPDTYFNRYLLNVDEIVQEYKTLLTQLLVFNPKIKIIFTVSPVRHWKDGAHGNQLSKSTLFLAIQQLVDLFESCSYFSAFELLIDDLRDYRFYKDDMLHPNDTAIQYIWKHFLDTFFSSKSLIFVQEMHKLDKARSHKILNANSTEHQLFVDNQIKKINNFVNKYPNTNFHRDLSYFKQSPHHKL